MLEPNVADGVGIVEEQGNEREGARQESSAEREAKKNPSEKQDLEKPSEGRDKPPAIARAPDVLPPTPPDVDRSSAAASFSEFLATHTVT